MSGVKAILAALLALLGITTIISMKTNTMNPNQPISNTGVEIRLAKASFSIATEPVSFTVINHTDQPIYLRPSPLSGLKAGGAGEFAADVFQKTDDRKNPYQPLRTSNDAASPVSKAEYSLERIEIKAGDKLEASWSGLVYQPPNTSANHRSIANWPPYYPTGTFKIRVYYTTDKAQARSNALNDRLIPFAESPDFRLDSADPSLLHNPLLDQPAP